MIVLEKTKVFGWEQAIRGMRNPLNSWEKSDSDYITNYCEWCEEDNCPNRDNGNGCMSYHIGKNDISLMKKLAAAGTDHRKFLRMITVYWDITAPLYWWKEFDTYKVGTVANSCSTMHKLTEKEFSIDDFSHNHIPFAELDKEHTTIEALNYHTLEHIVSTLNTNRKLYLKTKDKKYWWNIIQLLPSSYNQKRTVMLNYEVLANIYKSRKNHKLDEWKALCYWIEELPYFAEIMGIERGKIQGIKVREEHNEKE